jgi:ParB-like chromosome segregation protein Spo0J
MKATANSSSSPVADDERLVRLPLARLHPHPLNANLMSDERLAKLKSNIEREGRCPPVVVRPHPLIREHFELLDGHQRVRVLRSLGHADALCYVWPCDDATALVLLATLNRLEGEDVPARRAALLAELTALISVEDLALLLPEDAAQINDTLSLVTLGSAALLAQLEAAARHSSLNSPRLISFAVLPDDEGPIEEAVARAAATLSGPNRRGRALAVMCRAYLEGCDG